MTSRTCTNCHKVKTMEVDFYKSNHCTGGYRQRCKKCCVEQVREWGVAHPERLKFLSRLQAARVKAKKEKAISEKELIKDLEECL